MTGPGLERSQKSLRRGDWVEVKSAKEILETLDEEGSVGKLPFMPEMLPYCGKRFSVDVCASKICDTIKKYHSRSIPDAVLLKDQFRCDGSGHDGCQAECRIYWKGSWLRRIDPAQINEDTRTDDAGLGRLEEKVSQLSKRTSESGSQAVEIYRCQATELYNASEELGVWDPRPYVREFTIGNVRFGRFLRITARAAVETFVYKFRMIYNRVTRGPSNWSVHLPGTRKGPPMEERLNLQPGEWVQVKTKEEIAATLDSEGKDRGLWFDKEMFPFCGGTYQVRQRVNRFIDDRTGRMIEFRKDVCVTLEGVVCSGEHSLHRYFCPRAIYPYWRESWLRRAGAVEPVRILRGVG